MGRSPGTSGSALDQSPTQWVPTEGNHTTTKNKQNKANNNKNAQNAKQKLIPHLSPVGVIPFGLQLGVEPGS